MRSFRIVLDGRRVGRIARGETVKILVEPGEHSLQLRFQWWASPMLLFTASPGDVIALECGNKVSDPSDFKKLLQETFISRDAMLYVRHRSRQDMKTRLAARRPFVDLGEFADSQLYYWRLRPPLPSGHRWLTTLAVMLVVLPVGIYLGLSATYLVLPGAVFWVAMILGVLFPLYMLIMSLSGMDNPIRTMYESLTSERTPEFVKQHFAGMDAKLYSVQQSVGQRRLMMIAYVLFFFAMSTDRFWYADGFSGRTGERINWLLYLYENMIDLVLLGIPSGFDFKLSDIKAVSASAKASIVFLKFSIAYGIAQLVATSIAGIFRQREFVGSKIDALHEVVGRQGASPMQLEELGTVVLHPEPISYEHQGADDRDEEKVIPG